MKMKHFCVLDFIGLMKVNKQIINVHAEAAVLQDQGKGFNLF